MVWPSSPIRCPYPSQVGGHVDLSQTQPVFGGLNLGGREERLVPRQNDEGLDGVVEPVVCEQFFEAVLIARCGQQALSGSDGAIGELSAADLDRHWAIDARASILLAQAFAAQHDDNHPASVVFLTSGQGLGPMPGEVAYAAAKAAIAGVTTTIADQLADRGIRVNTVNPGPVDTGYLTDEAWQTLAPMFPFGRFGHPDDPARLIAWLTTAEASWITGQVINSEGGFGRWRPRRT